MLKPQKQLIVHDPERGQHGDCQRTCIAVILGLDAADVPHFCDDPTAKRGTDQWWAERQRKWLEIMGLTYATFAYAGYVKLDDVLDWTSRANPETPMILAGRSHIGTNHVVVVKNGEIVCDPSGNGIAGPTLEETWEVSVLSVL